MKIPVIYEDLGTREYKSTWEYQELVFDQIIQQKLQKRDESTPTHPLTGYLIFVEHPHVYTLGKSGTENNLLINDSFLKKINATYYKSNRGGDITYHGPGQVVGYPIFDLEPMGLSVKKYIDQLEEVIILTLAEYGLSGQRLNGATGVWLDPDIPGKARKICAIGVKASRYVTMHGFALNVNTNLHYFSYINPCGFIDKGVTSLAKEVEMPISIDEVKEKLKDHFADVFSIVWK